jgi:hypothetical protein
MLLLGDKSGPKFLTNYTLLLKVNPSIYHKKFVQIVTFVSCYKHSRFCLPFMSDMTTEELEPTSIKPSASGGKKNDTSSTSNKPNVKILHSKELSQGSSPSSTRKLTKFERPIAVPSHRASTLKRPLVEESSTSTWQSVAVLALVSFIVRIFRFNQPTTIVPDEKATIEALSKYMAQSFFVDYEPPLVEFLSFFNLVFH